MKADFLFNLSFNAERENVTSREHSFNTIPCGVMLSTTNLLPVRTISMMVPMVMCSMWFICSKYKRDTFYHQIPAFVSGRGGCVVGLFTISFLVSRTQTPLLRLRQSSTLRIGKPY
jgi:hypothetical protein